MHKKILQIASPYHHGILARYSDAHKGLSKKQMHQVIAYGTPGVLDQYNPHVTLFYFPFENRKIENFAKRASVLKKFEKFYASKIVIAELGYNGNIERIVYEINLK